MITLTFQWYPLKAPRDHERATAGLWRRGQVLWRGASAVARGARTESRAIGRRAACRARLRWRTRLGSGWTYQHGRVGVFLSSIEAVHARQILDSRGNR